MTAPSKSIVAILDAQIASGKPIDTVLMTSIRDALVNVEEQISFGFTPAQAHNHDGLNSATIPIGANSLRNGSFESGFNGWAWTGYTGGSYAVQAAGNMDGANCLAVTSTVVANGGGYAQTTEYEACTAGRSYSFKGQIKASVANVSSKVEVVWFDNTQTQISLSTIYTSTNTPIVATEIQGSVSAGAIAPSNARYKQLRITGGIPATGSAFGTVYFDGLVAYPSVNGLIKFTVVTATNAAWVPDPATTRIVSQPIAGGGAGGGTTASGGVGLGGKAGAMAWGVINSPIAASYAITVGAGGAGAAGSNGAVGGASAFGSTTAAGGYGGGTTQYANSSGSSEGGQNGFGAGGAPQTTANTAGNAAAANTGGGGSGSNNSLTAASTLAGGAGGSGIVLVWEYA